LSTCDVLHFEANSVSERGVLTFGRLVTTAVLKRDFDLDVELPDDRLCPPVSNRWNYVRWIQELLDTSSPTYTDAYDPDRRVTGLDIGTGASAIYPILALKTRPSWYMCATDIDERSLTYAKKNLQVNGLEPRAQVLLTEPSDPLIPLSALGFEKLDFTMCNPPFFSTEEEMNNSLQGKGKNDKPRSICTGTPTEMVCSGGDLGFVSRIFDESKKLHDKVQWYSAMFGKLASANAMVQKLRENKVSNFAVCNLFVSGKTRRWAVAWSFGDLRPTDVSSHSKVLRFLRSFLMSL
jgi:23S rRNA (adenine1618-N6)-methyltransferase